MRELKFRAWDKENKKMYEVELIGENVLKLAGAEWENREGFEVMQYTGLKDKNGQEIYEGDIIKYEWDGKTRIDVIVFNAPMFTPSHAMRWSLYEDEVIGNIYEHPHLLQGEQ